MWRGRAFPKGPGLSVHTPDTHTHTNTPRTQAKKRSSVNTDPCERPGFMELMGGCMGTFPGGSFCLFFWWRSRRRRPSSSHHEDRRAGERERESEGERISGVLWGITAEVTGLYCKRCKKTLRKLIVWGEEGRRNNNLGTEASGGKAMAWLTKWCERFQIQESCVCKTEQVYSLSVRVTMQEHLSILKMREK